MSVEAFLDVIADLVAQRLEQRAVRGPRTVYSSVSLPPDCPSRERFNRLVKPLPGASKAGRIWSVPSAAWDEFRSKKRPSTVRDLAERSVRAAGYRRVV